MYDELMGLGALDMESIKKEGMSLAVTGVSAVAGAAIAQMVVKKVPGLWKTAPAWFGEYAVPALPLIPLVVGVSLGLYGRSAFSEMDAPNKRALTDGAAIGMIAYSLAAFVEKIGAAKDMTGFQINGLGQDFSVQAYLNGAPTSIERLNGAPMSIERLNGAPTSIETLNGYSELASTLM